MSSLRRWSRLSRQDRRLTIQAWGWLVVASLRLRLAVDGKSVEGIRRSAPARLPMNAGSVDAAVRRASRFVPGARCLAEALAAHAMLLASGEPSIRYAVTRDSENGEGLKAHAWVEMDGRRVAGDPPDEGAVILSVRAST